MPSPTAAAPRRTSRPARRWWTRAPRSCGSRRRARPTTPPTRRPRRRRGYLFTTFPASAANYQAGFDPERNTLYEIGAKIGLLGDRLGVYGALYRIDKSNATQSAPNGDAVQTSDEQRNQGIEIGITGQVTPAWTINANYTAMDSETRSSTTPANVGKRVQYVPENAAALWTTYAFNKDQPWNLTVGGGVTWRDQVHLNAANTAEAPANLTFDAVVSHRINDNLRLQVNGYNLGDALNYDSLFGSRALPSPGRTVLVTMAAEF